MSIIRQIKRNKIKYDQGNNKIRKAWRSYQIDKYSIQGYCDMYNKNHSKIIKTSKGKKIRVCKEKLTPANAYVV